MAREAFHVGDEGRGWAELREGFFVEFDDGSGFDKIMCAER